MAGQKRRRLTTVRSTGAPPGSIARKARSARKARNRMVAVPRNKMAFPSSMRTKLRYVEHRDFTLTTTTNAVSAQFNALGMFDPDVNLGGHQPRGFDEFMTTYGSYTVIGSTCSVNYMYRDYDGPTLLNLTGSLLKTMGASSSDENHIAQSAVVCGIHKGVELLTAGTAAEQMEKDRTKWDVITPQSGAARLGSSLAAKDFYGAGAVVGAEGFSGDASLNPTNPLYWEVWCAKTDADNSASRDCTVTAYITLEFDVVFTEPKTLGAS